MTFSQAITTCFSKYATFTGRATRPEYWYFVLFTAIVSAVFQVLSNLFPLLNAPPALIVMVVISFLIFIPALAVSVRRLHDIGRSGWWVLICFVPLIGWILLIYWHCKPGVGANDFGPVPEGGAAATS